MYGMNVWSVIGPNCNTWQLILPKGPRFNSLKMHSLALHNLCPHLSFAPPSCILRPQENFATCNNFVPSILKMKINTDTSKNLDFWKYLCSFLLIANAAHPFQCFLNVLYVVSLSILACMAVLAFLSAIHSGLDAWWLGGCKGKILKAVIQTRPS